MALSVMGGQLDVMSLVVIILPIGIVKKNAVVMIDFARTAERDGLSPRGAIVQACVLRFRPIVMTMLCSNFGALPLALGTGVGFELRRPLGIAVIGGLAVSRLLTLHMRPIIYLHMERFGAAVTGVWRTLRGVVTAPYCQPAE